MLTARPERSVRSLQDFLEDLHRLSPEDFLTQHGDGFLIHAGIWTPALAPAAAAALGGSANQDLPVTEPVAQRSSPVYCVRRKQEAIFSFISVGCTPATDLVILHGTVGKFHAVFKRDGGGFGIEDAKSQNGTYVNHRRIGARSTGKPIRLKDGDVIRFGSVETIFYGLDGFRLLLASLPADAEPRAANS